MIIVMMMIRYRDSNEDLSPLFCSSSALGCAHGRDLERDALAILKENHSNRLKTYVYTYFFMLEVGLEFWGLVSMW